MDVKTFAVANPPPHRGGRNWLFVKLTTDEGLVGYGEDYINGLPFSIKSLAHLIEDVGKRFVVGSDPFSIEALWRKLYFGGYAENPDLTMMGVISALETACWDIVGKALNQPIYNLLGGKYHEKLRAYSYLYSSVPGERPTADPERCASRALQYVEKGFTAVKFDPVIREQPFAPHLSLDNLRHAETVVKCVREAVGDRCDILFGTHGQMAPASAIRLAKRIEKYDPFWFEEPVPPENIREMALVARSTSIPIATGERLSTKYEFAELIETQAASILQMALGRVGGILEAKKIAGMAEAHYAHIAPHLYCGPIEGAAAIQIDTCSPNFLIQEFNTTGLHAEILKKPIRFEKGYIMPPTEPGLGVELNEEVAAQHPAY